MDGGVDSVYRAFFGKELENRVLDLVRIRPEGHLPVGASIIAHTRVKPWVESFNSIQRPGRATDSQFTL